MSWDVMQAVRLEDAVDMLRHSRPLDDRDLWRLLLRVLITYACQCADSASEANHYRIWESTLDILDLTGVTGDD